MGIIELILGLLLVVLIANIFLALVPIPQGIAGTIIALLLVYLAWSIVF